MSTLGEISVEGNRTLGGILSEGKLRVPSNQREFSWKPTHVRELFQDIKPIIDASSGNEYFLGTVVVLRDDKEHFRIVVDGQQRLATTAIFLGAIRDHFFNDKDQEGVTAIETEFLLTMELPARKSLPRLMLNDSDHLYFEHRVLLKPGDDKRKDATRREHLRSSHRLMNQAAAAAAAQVNDIVKNLKSEDKTNALMKWVNFFKHQARVILVTVQDEATAYIVFETMNDRGLELSAIDLIKNRLFALSSERLNETKHHWTKMLGTLESVQSSTIAKDYVRHYWISKHGRTRAPVLFKAIKDEVSNQSRAIEFAAELETNAAQYVALLDPDHKTWKSYGPAMADQVAALKTLDVRQIRPLLISVVRRFPAAEVRKVFHLAVSWCVRLLAADQLGRGALETEYESAALEVHQRAIRTAHGLTVKMKPAVPDDSKFEADFSIFNVTNDAHAKYLLTRLDIAESGEKSPVRVANDDVTLEHVLPRTPKDLKDWQLTAEEHEEYVDRLGNLALFPQKPNSEVGNEKFAIKRAVLGKQPNTLTKEIAQRSGWGKKEIEDRQKRLAKLAIKAWPLRV